VAVLFDTKICEPGDRSESWSEAHRDIFFPLDVRFASADASRGRIEGVSLGPLRAYRVRSHPSVVRRSGPAIRAFDPEQLVVATQLQGRTAIEQAGRRSVLATGALSSWDSSRAFSVLHSEPFDLLLLIVPLSLLGPRAEKMYRRTAGKISETSPIGSLAARFFRHVWGTLASPAPIDGEEDLADAVLALVRALHPSGPEDSAAARRLPSAALLAAIKSHVDQNLGDPLLSPESIAQAHSISKRYLHALFALEGISVSSWVRHRRLEACRRDLRDPALAHDSISAIARHWALSSPAHFSRLFRYAYGCSPSEFRRESRT
jgi:AraC-like DNA-binding protein